MQSSTRAARHVVLIAAVAAFACFGGYAAVARAEDPVAAALEAYRNGEYEKAVELAEAVPAEDPARLRALYLLGEASLALEKWTNAEVAFLQVIEKKPDSTPAAVGLARAQAGAGTTEKAISTLEKAIKRDAKDAGAHRALGEIQFAKNDLEKARTELELAVKFDPKDPLASRSLVEVHIKSDKVDLAVKEAERLVKALPDHPMGHFLHGYVLDRQGRDKDAIAEYENAIAKDDKFLDAHKNLAILCVAKNPSYGDKERTKKAMEHFQRYFELGGKDEALKGSYEQMKAFLESQKKTKGG